MAFQALNAPSSSSSATAPSASSSARAAVVLDLVDNAFATKPEVQAAIRRLLGATPGHEHIQLFESIAQYVQELQHAVADNLDERESKRRKLDSESGSGIPASNGLTARPAANAAATNVPISSGGTSGGGAAGAIARWSGKRFEGISFTAPQRKKLTLEVSAKAGEGVRALNGEGTAEFGIAYAQLEHIFRLPIPEKPQSQHHFCAFPHRALQAALAPSPSSSSAPVSTSTTAIPEPLVWTCADVLPRGADADAITPSAAVLASLRQASTKVSVVEPSATEFASAIPQPHRKGEAAFHVKGFRGSKEGFLYLMAPGIVWGFKKPLLFFPFSAIASVSYTAVLQRTFNLVVTAMVDDETVDGDAQGESREEEIEFQMLDQADFAGIDAYVKRHSLNDASMAEARKAKKLNINPGRRGADAGGEADGGEEASELEKAQREAEAAPAQEDDSDDEEDDENFDPGTEGESEGSGSESGEDGEGDGGGGGGGDDDDEEEEDDDDEDEE